MTPPALAPHMTRRQFGIGFGALVATFSLKPSAGFAQIVEGAAPVSFAKTTRLDGWIRISANNTLTVFTGKAELGQGILTALAQIVAEELDVGFAQIHMISADTTRGPDEGYTYGSQSIEQSGGALRIAAAQARAVLLASAAARWKVPATTLSVRDGTVSAADGRRQSYGEIAQADPGLFDRDISPAAQPKPPREYRLVGRSARRIDLPTKILAEGVYLQDMRLPGTVFGRVVRPPTIGATLESVDEASVRRLPGVLAIVRLASFLGVVAEREEQAIRAAAALRDHTRWRPPGTRLPDEHQLPAELQKFAREDILVKEAGQSGPAPAVAKWVEASYSRPYLSQASIGPSCAVARFIDGHMTVWSHTQGAFPLRKDMATVLELPPAKVDVIHVQAAGCYGHNGADDAALDAALLARAVEGRPVKLQWMREDEFAWAPISPAMFMHAKAGLSSEGRIVDWRYDVWGNTHATRPGQPGGVNLLAAWYMGKGYHVSPPLKIPQPYGNGDRNAIPYYDLPRQRILHHLLTDMPLRTGSLRTLGGHANMHAIECFMDELATAAGVDPVAFRLHHLSDARARAVIETAAKAADWKPGWKSDGRIGRGFAFARYKNISTFAAVAVDIALDRSTGAVKILNVHAAIDVGQVINPDGVRSQSEGGVIQGMSFAWKEQMHFDRTRITSVDWSGYPIMTFDEIPPIHIVIIDRPGEPNLGAGEGTVGPASAALANAISNAAGQPMRRLPLSPERIREVLRG